MQGISANSVNWDILSIEHKQIYVTLENFWGKALPLMVAMEIIIVATDIEIFIVHCCNMQIKVYNVIGKTLIRLVPLSDPNSITNSIVTIRFWNYLP